MEINFNGKRAVVTGAGQGIGRGIVEGLVKCGASVIALDMNKPSLAEAVKAASPIDLVVNNAGLAIIDPLTEITEEKYEKMFSVNIKGLINVTKGAVNDMVSRKSPGSIVNISSQASKAGLLNHGLYCATKGAVDAFTRAVALEYGSYNIRINCVNPTVVMTQLGRQIWANPTMGGPMLAKIPLQKFAEINNVVDAVLFLLSDRSSMITGNCMAVDGGFLAC